jgi:hypothetical protein
VDLHPCTTAGAGVKVSLGRGEDFLRGRHLKLVSQERPNKELQSIGIQNDNNPAFLCAIQLEAVDKLVIFDVLVLGFILIAMKTSNLTQ